MSANQDVTDAVNTPDSNKEEEKYPGVKSDVHNEMKMVSVCTSGSTSEEQGSLNVASEENSPTPRSLNKSRLKMNTSVMLDD